MLNPIYTANMTGQQRSWFYAEYQQASKDELVGVLLALFLGGLGVHRFYMGQTGSGILYLIFFWTGVPSIIGFVECFLMPGRVRAYNAAQAQIITARVMTSGQRAHFGTADVGLSRVCRACGSGVQSGAGFCARCGAAMLAAG